MAPIIITTLNARYLHTAFGLRYLYANLGELQGHTQLLEFSINQRSTEIVEKLLEQQPQIIGFGVYIWNVAEINAIVAILKQVAPQITVVLGGPEVSFPADLPEVTDYADYIITGPGEISFRRLCEELLADARPEQKIITGETVALSALCLPYRFYTDTDLHQRVVYVEASRGCPFKCEFCLSALDTTAKPFELNAFLDEMHLLYQRGARNFKFIDRTFNLKIDSSVTILEFFLDRISDDLHLHFEVIPDNLPDRLKATIQKFPAGTLQFEIGVQSFDPVIQQRISRKQDNQKTADNLSWLRLHTQTHIHADLITGLPGDTLDNFGSSFDQLIALNPQEIQVGILKRLRGAPINRHSADYKMQYDPNPPYTVLSTADMDFFTLQRLQRFARYWDLIGNSGRFVHCLPLILADQPFARFLQLSDALYMTAETTWQIGLKRLFKLIYQIMIENLGIALSVTEQAIYLDHLRSGEKGHLEFLQNRNSPAEKRANINKRQRQAIANKWD